MREIAIRTLRRIIFSVAAAAAVLAPAAMAHAAAPGSLYSYTLDGSTAVIANEAASYSTVNLSLLKDWSPTTFGVSFAGNLTNKQSVGYAKPLAGNTIDIAGPQAFGAGVMFKYKAPAGGCFADSPNVTQIGKYGSGLAQFKLQLSDCGKNRNAVFPQCRAAGLTGANTVKTGSTALIDGQTYVLECIKSPDPSSGNATLVMHLTLVDGVLGNSTYTNSFSITKTGALRSTQYLSVANQYPLKAQTNNTDQFNGEIAQLAYCTGPNTAAAKECLDAEVPAL